MKAFLTRFRRSSRKDSERGASLVEFALVAPLFFLLVFGMIEGAALFFARNTIGLAASDAVREASLASNATDEDVLSVIARAEDNAFGSNITRVILFRAEDEKAEPSSACLTGGGDSDCVVYDGSVLGSTTFPACTAGWCNRSNPDGIGVWIVADYDGLTGLNPFPISWTVQKFALIEPGLGTTP